MYKRPIRVGDAVRHKDGRQGIVLELRPIGDGELIKALVELTDGTPILEPSGYFQIAPRSDDGSRTFGADDGLSPGIAPRRPMPVADILAETFRRFGRPS